MKHRLDKTNSTDFPSSRYAEPTAKGDRQQLAGDPKTEPEDMEVQQKIAFQRPEEEDLRVVKSENNQSRTR